MQIEHHHARLSDMVMHYAAVGAGEPVDLLQGWPSTWYEWRRVIAPLATRYRVIAPDLRGLGDSLRPLDGDKKNVAANVWELLSCTLGCMDLTDAPTVLAQLAAAFEHFNEVHPHSSLKMRSPREFRRQRVEQMRRAQLEQPALRCV